GPGQGFAGGTGFSAVSFPVVSFSNTESVPASALSGPVGLTGSGVRKVLLGSVTLQVGTVSSTFLVGARDLSNTNTTFFTTGTVNGLDLDSAGQPPFNGASDVTFAITINALPEPASASLVALGGVLLAARRRGRCGSRCAQKKE